MGFSPTRMDVRGGTPAISRPIAALPADFDGDGIGDIAVVNKYIDGFLVDGSVTLLKGDVSGEFVIASTQIVEGGGQWGAAEDFNNDGNVDVAVVTNDSALILLGNGLDGFLPAITVPVPFDPAHVTVADMNRDGKLDLVVTQKYIGQPAGRVTVLRGDGTGHFTLMTPSPVGQDPRGAVVGDFNEDGKLDVVTANNLSNNISFLPGLGNGNFGPRANTPLAGSGSYAASADFNWDGKLDLIVTGETVSTPAMFLTGNGNGTFQVVSTLSVGDTPRNPVICDFNRDGFLDVAVPNAGTADVSLLYGIGGGAFGAPITLGSDGGPMQAALYDIDTDGTCDLVLANDSTNSVSVMRGGPLGNPGTPTLPVGGSPLGEAAADFDGDGHVDLAVVNRDDDTLTVYRGDGEGRMALFQTLPSPIAPAAIAAGDFNLDGFPDLVTAHLGPIGNQQSDTIDIFFNDGAGHFSFSETRLVGDVPLDIEIGDFDGDGRPDIAVANSQSDKVSFFYSQPGNQFGNVKNIRIGEPQRSLAAADFNGDGHLDLAVGVMGQNAFVPMLGTAQGGFSQGALVQLGATASIDAVVARDINGDTIPDLAALSQPADPFAPGELRILPGNGNGTFGTLGAPLATGTFPEALVIVDLDRDGALDAVVANRFDNDVMIFQGGPIGEFTPTVERFGVGSGPYDLVSADFNEDLRTDVAVVAWGGNSVSILLNNTVIPDPIDTVVFVSDHRFVWDPVPGAASYHVYRDDLGSLDYNNFGQCLAPGLLAPLFDDLEVPPLGGGYFYLVSAVTAGAEGPLGYSANCLKRPNFNPCTP